MPDNGKPVTRSPGRRETDATSDDLRRQLAGYGLTTALILYRMPDSRSLLQSFLWQFHDLYPHFPELNRFLAFWTREMDGPLHSVRVAHSRLVGPTELRAVNGVFLLN